MMNAGLSIIRRTICAPHESGAWWFFFGAATTDVVIRWKSEVGIRALRVEDHIRPQGRSLLFSTRFMPIVERKCIEMSSTLHPERWKMDTAL
jgi:hypothetical protein